MTRVISEVRRQEVEEEGKVNGRTEGERVMEEVLMIERSIYRRKKTEDRR